MPKSYLADEPACQRAERNFFDPYLQVVSRLRALDSMGHVTDKPNDVRMPKSYLADEPACQRAERNFFDPYLQVVSRLRALDSMGHVTDKVELIVLGGTWSDYSEEYLQVVSRLRALDSMGHVTDKVELIVLGGTWSDYSEEYQIWFISELFRALNDAGSACDGVVAMPQGTGSSLDAAARGLFPLASAHQIWFISELFRALNDAGSACDGVVAMPQGTGSSLDAAARGLFPLASAHDGGLVSDTRSDPSAEGARAEAGRADVIDADRPACEDDPLARERRYRACGISCSREELEARTGCLQAGVNEGVLTYNQAISDFYKPLARERRYRACGISCSREELEARTGCLQAGVNEGVLTYNQAISDFYKGEAWRDASSFQRATLDDLDVQHRANEGAAHRVVGLVIETRPDLITSESLTLMRRLGCTKVQMGVQSLDERVLAANRRNVSVDQISRAFSLLRLFSLTLMRRLGCTKVQMGVQSLDERVLAANRRNVSVDQISRAFSLLRLFGFKIHIHFMVNLLGATPEGDKRDYARLVSDPAFLPDEVKLYPCCLVESAHLKDRFEDGSWRPYAEDVLVDVLEADTLATPPYARISRMIRDISSGDIVKDRFEDGSWRPYAEDVLVDVLEADTLATPPYARISRMIRDISSGDIVAGNKKTNLRQMVEGSLERKGAPVREIRHREIAGTEVALDELSLDCVTYETAVGEERFLQWVTPAGSIAGFLRLSLPHAESLEEGVPVRAGEAMIREVHVYGKVFLQWVTPAGSIAGFLRLSLPHAESLEEGVPVRAGEAMIREVHVYGKVARLHEAGEGAQHAGLGKRLVEEACAQARGAGYSAINVISSVGTRIYYRGLGFDDNGLYQRKSLAYNTDA